MSQLPYMKKYLLIGGLGLLTAGGATAAALYLSAPKKKAPKEQTEKKMEKKQCSRSYKTACL